VHEKTDKGYRLATKHGILLGSYTRNQFELTDSLYLGPSDISIEHFISLRRAVKADSLFEGQAFFKCGCCGKSRCETNRCACRRLDKCAIVDAIQILLVKLNECIYLRLYQCMSYSCSIKNNSCSNSDFELKGILNRR